jgi:hypothetical protein
MIDIQKKQFEDWWDTQWIRFDSDRETINSRKSCARDGFEFGLSTVWTEVERLKKELEDARQPEVPIPTVEELAEAMYQNNTALLTNVEARYIAKVVHKLLTKGRGEANDIREQMREAIFETFAHGLDTPQKAEDYLNGVTPDPRALQTFEEWFEWLTKKNGQSYEKTDPIYQWAELAWNWRLKLTPSAQPQPLVEALEDIAVDDGVDKTSAKIAREALAKWKRGGYE